MGSKLQQASSHHRLGLLLFAVLSCSHAADSPHPASKPIPAAPRTEFREAQAILDDMARARQAIQPFDEQRGGDAGYLALYREQNREAWTWLCELSLELLHAHPDHGHVLLMMRERWRLQCAELGLVEDALREMEGVLADANSSPALADEARYSRALALLGELRLTPTHPDPVRLAQAQTAVDAMLALEARDSRCLDLLWQLALLYDGDTARERAAFARLLELFPTSSRSSLYRGKLRQIDGIGMAFDMPPFRDAIDGREVDLGAWRGKLIVVVFWAARAQPALERLAEYQRLQQEYASEGVEFVGVSLDDSAGKGGRELLIQTVAERGLTWPQNYLGAGWLSPFAQSWGITRLPQVFLVDRQGLLASTAAQANLESALRSALAGQESKQPSSNRR